MTMAALITSLFIFLSFLKKPVIGLQLCNQISCSPTSQEIRFPFGLNTNNRRCSYPGFGLHCDSKNQTILNLRHAGDFIVQYIYYETQEIHIKDAGNCLARRFLDNFSLSGSPFIGEFNRSFIFLNCSAQNISDKVPLTNSVRRVDCLSNENDTVLALPRYETYGPSSIPGCRVISNKVEVPVLWDPMAEGHTAFFWAEPDCLACEQTDGICGFKDGSIRCHHHPSQGLSRNAKYGIIIGSVGIPGLLCIIILGCYLYGKLKTSRWSRYSSTNLTTTFPHPLSQSATGLDGPSIELYKKTLLGESRRLPKPNDNTCPICLCEYQPKETLRTITECNHYFHVECIDEWLKMNVTCPLCRNSPNVSSIATPTSTLFSSSP